MILVLFVLLFLLDEGAFFRVNIITDNEDHTVIVLLAFITATGAFIT